MILQIYRNITYLLHLLETTSMSNIICFRIINKDKDFSSLNKINASIRQDLLEEGNFYIVQTKIKGIVYLRATIMNPITHEEHFKKFIEKIKSKTVFLLNS